MSNLLRTSTCLLALVLAGLAMPTDGAAQRTRGATPEARVTSLKAAGSSALEIATELRRVDRLDADQVRKLLAGAGFDSRTVESAVQEAFGLAASGSTATSRTGTATSRTGTATSRTGTATSRTGTATSRTGTATSRTGTATSRTGTATRRGTPNPVTSNEGPSRVGPAPPRLTVQLRSVQSGAATLDVHSSDDPTAMRFANNLEELRAAPWLPYEPTATFTLNGLFPAQVVVQVGKPVGYAAHPVNGPHVESDPQVVRNAALLQGENHVQLYWSSQYGTYEGTPGTMVFRLTGLGDARQIRVDDLSVCTSGSGGSPFGPPNGATALTHDVTPYSSDGFDIRIEGRFTRPASGCVASFMLLGDGGNFDPGVQYSVRAEDAAFNIRPLSRLRTEETASFAYRPKLQNAFYAAPGECGLSHEDGKIVIEAASGVVPLICEFWSPALLLPEVVEVTALNWRLEKIVAGEASDFHCKLGPLTRPTPGVHFEAGRGSVQIAPGATGYFHTTNDANPVLPGGIVPEVDADLSTAKERNWILPLRAVLSCDPRESLGSNPVGDRIRLTLDNIEYEAPSGFPFDN